MSLRLAIVVGARPQFIKYGPVYQALKGKGVEQLLIHTGQHYDKSMSDLFFDQLQLPKPDYNLGICNLSHAEMTGNMMSKLEEISFTSNPNGKPFFTPLTFKRNEPKPKGPNFWLGFCKGKLVTTPGKSITPETSGILFLEIS